MNRYLIFSLIAVVFILSNILAVEAGGPLVVNKNGEFVLWDANKTVTFNSDQGSLGLLSNAEAVQITQELFSVWDNVPTSSITFQQGEQLSKDITGSNIMDFLNDLNGELSPIIFDDDGSITDALNGRGASDQVIGFAGPNFISFSRLGVMNEIVAGWAVMNGKFFDGKNNPGELSLVDFRGTFAHEFGHFIGLGHTQINLEHSYSNDPTDVPLMFPIALDGMGETLQVDDVAAVSTMYPSASFEGTTANLSGKVFLADGSTQFQGANVIARNVVDPKTLAYSSVSGFLHRDTSDPSAGGASDDQLVGFYEIRGLPPGNYIVSIEQVDLSFSEGSGVGALLNAEPFPGIPEFYNPGETNSDTGECAGVLNVIANKNVEGVDFVINSTGSSGAAVNESEPNDSFSEPQSVSTSAVISGSIAKGDSGGPKLSFANGSTDVFEDVYSIQINPDQWLTLSLTSQSAASEFDMLLVSEDTTLIINPFTTPDGAVEILGPMLLEPGNYFVAVSLVDGILNPSGDYTLEIAGACVGDNAPVATPEPTSPSTPPSPAPTPTTGATPTPGTTPAATPTPVGPPTPGLTPVPTSTPIGQPTPEPTKEPTPSTTETATETATETSTPTPNPPANDGQARLEARIEPNPAPQSNNGKWDIKVFVKETNGVGVTINRVQAREQDGSISLDIDNEGFTRMFAACGAKQDGFVPGFDEACAELSRGGKPGFDTFTFFGVDQNGNDVEASATVTLLEPEGGGGCLASSILWSSSNAYSENEPKELRKMRHFRDSTLGRTLKGLSLIKLYYKHSPEVIKIVNADADLKFRMSANLKALSEIAGKPGANGSIVDFVKNSVPMWLERDTNELIDDIYERAGSDLQNAINEARALVYE